MYRFLLPISIILIAITIIPFVDSSEDTKITATIVGSSEINLDTSKRFIRADIEITEYDPQDGYYHMKIVHLPTGKVISNKEILPTKRTDDKYGVNIGYMVKDEDSIGEYEIEITTELGTAFATAKFIVFDYANPISKPKPVSIPKPVPPKLNLISDKVVEEGTELSFTVSTTDVGSSNKTRLFSLANNPPSGASIDPESGLFRWVPTDSQGPGSFTITVIVEDDIGEDAVTFNVTVNGVVDQGSPKIPEWIRNVFIWYGEGSVSEDEILNAIRYLVDNEIIKL